MNLTLGSFILNIPVAGNGGRVAVEAPGVVAGAENPPINTAVVKALKSNGETIFIGDKTVTEANGFPLEPGDAVSIDVQGLGLMNAVAKKAADKLAIFWVGP